MESNFELGGVMSGSPESMMLINPDGTQSELPRLDKKSLGRDASVHEAMEYLKVVAGTSVGDDERLEIANKYADAMVDDEDFSSINNGYLRLRIIREGKSGETVKQTMSRLSKEDKE